MRDLLLAVLLADMGEPSPTALVALIAAIGPVGAYLLAARKMSGKIGTSDAEQLWAESKAIRDWSKERLEMQDKEITDLREALSALSSRCSALEKENETLRDDLLQANDHISKLQGVN